MRAKGGSARGGLSCAARRCRSEGAAARAPWDFRECWRAELSGDHKVALLHGAARARLRLSARASRRPTAQPCKRRRDREAAHPATVPWHLPVREAARWRGVRCRFLDYQLSRKTKNSKCCLGVVGATTDDLGHDQVTAGSVLSPALPAPAEERSCRWLRQRLSAAMIEVRGRRRHRCRGPMQSPLVRAGLWTSLRLPSGEKSGGGSGAPHGVDAKARRGTWRGVRQALAQTKGRNAGVEEELAAQTAEQVGRLRKARFQLQQRHASAARARTEREVASFREQLEERLHAARRGRERAMADFNRRQERGIRAHAESCGQICARRRAATRRDRA